MPAATPTPAAALSRLNRRLAHVPRTGWTPPPLPDLIERIDAAVARRREG